MTSIIEDTLESLDFDFQPPCNTHPEFKQYWKVCDPVNPAEYLEITVYPCCDRRTEIYSCEDCKNVIINEYIGDKNPLYKIDCHCGYALPVRALKVKFYPL